MTKQEAINLLSVDDMKFYSAEEMVEFLYKKETARQMAIKALEQEPCADAVSRQELLEKFATPPREEWGKQVNFLDVMIACQQAICEMPSVKVKQTGVKSIKACEEIMQYIDKIYPIVHSRTKGHLECIKQIYKECMKGEEE